MLVDTLSDGAILSFGLESVDPKVHSSNWLNCDPQQAKTAIRLINKFGKERGERSAQIIARIKLHSRITWRSSRNNL